MTEPCVYKKLQQSGKPYPRTCPECKLGPCKHPIKSIDAQPVPVEPELLTMWREIHSRGHLDKAAGHVVDYIGEINLYARRATMERDTWEKEAKFQRDKCWTQIERAEKAEALAEQCQKIAHDWGQGVTDAETAIRELHKLFPIDSARAG